MAAIRWTATDALCDASHLEGRRSGVLEGQDPRTARRALAYQRARRQLDVIDRHTASLTSPIGAVVETGHGQLHLIEKLVHCVHLRAVGLFLVCHTVIARCVRLRRSVDVGLDRGIDVRSRHAVVDPCGDHRDRVTGSRVIGRRVRYRCHILGKGFRWCRAGREAADVLVVPFGGPLGLHALQRTPAVWGIS
jgi:hypothetical protein